VPPRALIVCPEAPFPPHGGGAMRTAAMIHYLAQRYSVDGIFFREAGSADPRQAIPDGLLCESVLVDLPLHSRSSTARVARNLRRGLRRAPPLVDRFDGHQEAVARFARGRHWDVVVVEHFWCAGYTAALRPHTGRLILDLHNIESVYYARCANGAPGLAGPLYRRFAAGAEQLEASWLPLFDLVLTTSEVDCRRAQQLSPKARFAVWPNTIPDRPVAAAEIRKQVIFSGNMEYEPNRDGVAWFRRHVWPRLRIEAPDLRWVLLGKNPHCVRAVTGGDPNISLTGAVDDALPEIARSAVSVVPLRSGSGTRVKILEAWAAGAPVVSTTIGAEGLPHAGMIVADEPAAFAGAVLSLLNSPSRRQALGAEGRREFDSTFSWDSGWKVLDRLGI